MEMYYNFGDANATIETNSESFMAEDVEGLTSQKPIEIVNLRSINEGHGDAKALLKIIINDFKDRLIILRAEPLFDTEGEYQACPDIDSRISKLVSFYESQGFMNINDYVHYENSVAMCYSNEQYQRLRSAINKTHRQSQERRKSK